MISVIIPTYNRASLLGRAIESVLGQSFRDFELLIIDDGSTDNTAEVVEGITDSRIRYVFGEHRGVSRARNIGVELSNRAWVGFLDSDDQWHPRKLERQIETLEVNPGFRLIHTNEIWIRNGKPLGQKEKHRKFGGWIFHRCLPLCLISPSSVLLDRRFLKDLGGFDESFPVCEDYELWLRVTSCQPVVFLDEPLITKFGGHADQLSRSRWGLDQYRLRALVKTVEVGGLTPLQELWAAREIVRKAKILAEGFGKRGKHKEESEYRRVIEQWTCDWPKRD
jgi:glycosyltransferase involved in cell wall biosynthesis